MNRERITSVRFNDREHAKATERAASLGLSLSSWIRSLTLRELKKRRRPGELPEPPETTSTSVPVVDE